MNVPAVFILFMLSALLIRGIRSPRSSTPHRGHQGRHRDDGDRHRLGLHQPGEPHAFHSRAPTYTRRKA